MRSLFLALLTVLSSSLFSQTQQFTLDNGLKILVREDHRAPIAVSMIWYNVGSADEPGGITGISHALEHLMFKGTPNYPLGLFSKTIAALGGQENAMTNADYTVFYEKIAAPHLAISFELEADRMQHLLLDKKEFDHEIKVIQEERRLRTDDNPKALAFERFLAAAHLNHAYHHPVIGWMSDLKQMTVDDARYWYQRYYAPNNATLVVVGDVHANDVLALAKRSFGTIPKRPLVKRKLQPEPPALGKKIITVQHNAQLPMLIMGYTVPSLKTIKKMGPTDPYALDVIAGILDAGEGARLNTHLVRGKQIASVVNTYYNPYARYQTQFVFFGTPSKNHTLSQLQAGIESELTRLQTTLVTPEELQRIKVQLTAQKTFERDSIFSEAMELGMLETVGLGYRTADSYVSHINSVTAQDIQKTAQRYFNETNMTVVFSNARPLSTSPLHVMPQ
jgi:zinc protease